MANVKKKGVLTGPDPDDRIVHEMLKDDKAKYERAGKVATSKATPAKSRQKK